MNNIKIGKETINIIKERKYQYFDKVIHFPDIDFNNVIVISPQDGKKLLEESISNTKGNIMCKISVINADSFQAGKLFDNALILNFANAHKPGGGFLLGENAQ